MIDAFILQLSAFATNAMAGHDTQEARLVNAQILWSVLTMVPEGQSHGASVSANLNP